MYEGIAMIAVVERAVEIRADEREREREDLANRVVGKIVDAWNKGQKK